jgi:hypothetical protein
MEAKKRKLEKKGKTQDTQKFIYIYLEELKMNVYM